MKIGKEFLMSEKKLELKDIWLYREDNKFIPVEIYDLSGWNGNCHFIDVKKLNDEKIYAVDVYKLYEAIDKK